MDPKSLLTYAEIHRQQAQWSNALSAMEDTRGELSRIVRNHADAIWVFCGCGTSYYLAQSGANLFARLTGLQAIAVPASEVLMFPQSIFMRGRTYVMVTISRSGTTSEIVLAETKARTELGIPTLAISCDDESEMAVNSDDAVRFPFQKEESVVMTGSFTTMLLSIAFLANLYNTQDWLTMALAELPGQSTAVVRENEGLIAKIGSDTALSDFVFLGQGPLYGIANEAALKMQEMAIVTSLSYHALEFRHGPMSTVTDETLLTVLCTNAGESYEPKLVEDMKKLGARILVFHAMGANWRQGNGHFEVAVPRCFHDVLSTFLYTPLLQLLGFYVAIAKGINPDTPKNLSQVVTL